MSVVTIRLPNKIVQEVDSIADQLHISRADYIRQAIENMNRKVHEAERKSRLIQASHRVRQESMLINAEFARIEHDPEI